MTAIKKVIENKFIESFSTAPHHIEITKHNSVVVEGWAIYQPNGMKTFFYLWLECGNMNTRSED